MKYFYCKKCHKKVLWSKNTILMICNNVCQQVMEIKDLEIKNDRKN